MVRGSNGTQVNAAKARSSVREDGPAVSQSMNPTNVPSRQTAFHGATSWWPITKPGRQVCPANQDTFAGTCRIGRRNPSTAKSTSGRRSPGWRPCWKEGLSYRPTCPRPRHLRRRRHGSVSMGQVGGPGGRELAAVFTAAAGFVRSGTSGTTPSDLSGHQRTELPPGWGMSMRTPANGANSDRTPSTWHSRKWLHDSRPNPKATAQTSLHERVAVSCVGPWAGKGTPCSRRVRDPARLRRISRQGRRSHRSGSAARRDDARTADRC